MSEPARCQVYSRHLAGFNCFAMESADIASIQAIWETPAQKTDYLGLEQNVNADSSPFDASGS